VHPGLRPERSARVGVVLHVFYPELLDELIEHLAHLPVPFDLVVTDASGTGVTIDAARMPQCRHVVVLPIANHGRDILPLVSVVNADLLAPYELVLKMHTKQSQWRAGHTLDGDGTTWRKDLLDALVGDENVVRRILGAFADDSSLGIVTAPGSVLGPEYWGDNQPVTAQLLRRLELPLDEPALRFAAGSMYWVRGFVLQGLRALSLTQEDFEPEAGQVNATTAHAIERLIGAVAVEAGLTVATTDERAAPREDAWTAYSSADRRAPRARVLPFYLPQFHPVPENDAWWGPGFTEWTNVTAAQPLYPGHHQPKLPRDLGYYDLRSPWVAAEQSRLAADAGLSGFMYYHYWFAGHRLLEAPIDDRLERRGDLPFCLMWANENWTRRWDGRSEDVLMGQDYERLPAEQFLEDSLPALLHPDYLRVGGAAVLAVYRPGQIPGVGRVVEAWRARAREAGVGDLLLLSVDVATAFDAVDGKVTDHGFDGTLGFPPHNMFWDWVSPHELGASPRHGGNMLSYASMVADAEKGLPATSSTHFPGVMVGFDNTARRQWTADVWYGANPYTFRRWLAAAVRAVANRPADQRIVFINAWNEWAEGAMLEPSDRFGLSFLQAVRDVLR
jgi:lipopolysaccharide biosynthesis protein